MYAPRYGWGPGESVLVYVGMTDLKTGSSEYANAPTPPAHALLGDASANGMPAALSRDQSPPNNMARHRTLRRAMASASAKMPRRLCLLGLTSLNTGSSESANAPTLPMSAPGGLARRFWGNASANGMPAALSRDQSPPNNMARHRTLRRALASASAKMPRRWCFGEFALFIICAQILDLPRENGPRLIRKWGSVGHQNLV